MSQIKQLLENETTPLRHRAEAVAAAVIAELNRRGYRFVVEDGEPYLISRDYQIIHVCQRNTTYRALLFSLGIVPRIPQPIWEKICFEIVKCCYQ